jgi:hypothetical protein
MMAAALRVGPLHESAQAPAQGLEAPAFSLQTAGASWRFRKIFRTFCILPERIGYP